MIIALVSVPYRGILFFNRNTPRYIYIKHSFRPLSGNLIFQFQTKIKSVTKNIVKVSVPYRGILFFNKEPLK